MKKIKHITVACDHCEKRHRVLPKQVGRTAHCKRCGQPFELRPREAIADPGLRSRREEVDTEKEYFIPISLTSSPMVDSDYANDLRAQTRFIDFGKRPERRFTVLRNIVVFVIVFVVLAAVVYNAYWLLIR